MIALGILIGFLFLIGILHRYDKSGLTNNQFSFLCYSTLFAFLILNGLSGMLFSQEGQAGLTDDSRMYPLLFYALWLYSSTLTGNKLTGHSGDWMGYGSGQGEWVSKPDE